MSSAAERPGRWRRPSLAAAVALLAGVGVLLGLGTWQLERLAWKHDLIARIEARMAAPPVTLGPRMDEPETLDYRRVCATGRFLHDREIYLASRTRDGRAGVHVVTPLVHPGLPPVLVNRGWVPRALKDPARRPAGQVGGRVTVTGIARVPRRRGLFTPDNDPAAGFWMVPDIPAMARAAGIAAPLPVIVEVGADGPGGWPKGGVTRVRVRNDHLEYALTWYALAAALLVVFVLYHRRRAPTS